ncbi:MAG TPA: glycosyltransferase family 2 protein [Gemmatimonadales bacterium]
MKVPISIVVPARDEGERITAFVSAHDWAAEIIVADNGSTDDTAARASAAGARVIDCGGLTIAGARNAGAEAASQEWIFALDTDEVVTPDLREELPYVLEAPVAAAYEVRRRNLYLGREQRRGRWGRDWVVRMYRKGLRFGETRVHESLVTTEGFGTLAGQIDHNPYRDLAHHQTKMDRYARWGAEELYQQGRRATVADLTLRPSWRFVKAYLIGGSVLDGRFGLITSLLGAETAFLKYAHLWALERERGEGKGAA